MTELDINFEQIVPWNGASDTGRDVRLKWQRNFERVANALQTIFNEFGKSDDFLRRKQADTALELITFAKGLVSDAQILAKQGILSEGDITAAKKLLVHGEMIAYSGLIAEGDIIAKKWIKAHEGIIIGKEGFAEGMSGFGGRIDENANAELESLRLRRFLEVPELRFNRTEVTLGNEWRSPGAGIIERVEPDIDENGNQLMTGTAWLKLEDGEYGAISVGDICQGIFHSLNSSENATEDSDDSKGNFQFAGFYTCYFTVTDIVGADNKEFRYQMRPISDSWSIAIHPSEAMTFNCYGSFTNPDRMTSQYTTRTYTRLLVHQNTWEIGASNIAMQWGDLSNLAIHGINMSGYSAYLNNIYMTGSVKQINAAGKEIKVANDMGDYVAGVHYDFYDRVSYNGGLWLCVAENGTNTEPSEADAAWLNQVPAAQSVTSRPSWKSSETPYAASTILKMADTVVISNKKTAEPPYALLTDQSGNYLTDSNGDYIVHSPLVQSADWDVMLDASGLVDGEDGESVEVRYSADGTNWHFPYIEGDKYMQQRIGDESPWSDIMPFIGKDGNPGEPGTDGKYPEYQWAVNDSATNHPTTGWQDTPPTTGDGEYLWMRTRTVDPNTLTATSWSTPVRIKGDVGESIKPIGAWHSGLNVPKLGVVTMGGISFLAKKATALPPLFCLTDENGNYLTSEDGGYLLTGEQNTEDYEFLVQSGKDGSDGKDYEWIFFLSDKETAPATPGSVQQDDYVPSGWTDDQTGVSETMPYEYTSFRTKKDGRWSDYSKPAIWAKWGKDGVSPIFADLDNEMDSIPLSAKGAVMERTIITTTASMWQGTTKLQLSNIAIDAPESIAATADKQTGVVTLTIANGIELAERNEVTIAVTAVVDGEEVSRTLTFTIAGVKVGANGEHATLYRVLTSVSAIAKRKDGSYSVNAISATRMKSYGKQYSECTEGTLKYSIDGGSEISIENNVGIDATKIGQKVQFIFYVGNEVVDKETVLVVVDGEDGKPGENAIYADIDNEMDSVVLAADGRTTAAAELRTTVSMWNGQTKVGLKSISVSSASGVTTSHNLSSGLIVFNIAKNTSLAEHVALTITVTASINGKDVSRTLTFTIAGVRAGADGKHAVVYKLLLSVNSVVKKSDGTYNVSGVSASRCKIENGVTSVCTEGKLKYLIDNKNPNSYETEIGNDVEIPSSSFSSKVRFTFYDSNGAILDRETVPMVSDGEGFVMMGNWRSGLSVPVRGVVMMNGCTFVAKKATALPPLFCLTDENGNYLTSEDGGYLLTGEQNTADYDLWAEKGAPGKDGVPGKDGAPGADGKPGAQGIPGMQGCILRYAEWQPNYEWRNDTNKTEEELKNITGGIRYLDCAFVRNNATSTGWDVYYATETHISTVNNAPNSEGSKWKEFSMNVPAIFTNIILAKQAHIDLLQGNDIMAKKADGTVTAGMSGGSDGIRFWSGATQENKATAPFRVNEQGESWLTNAHVSGEVNATSGVFKDVQIDSGTIGGFTIEKGTLRTSTLGSGRIIIEPGINKFIRINDDELSPLFYARNDSGVIMQLNAYGDNATALELLSNSSGSGVALRSTGDAYLVGRYSSVPSVSPHEKIMIAGLSVSCKNGSSFTSPTNVSPSTAWVDFLIANGDITLPSAKNCAGKVLFVKAKGVISCQETNGGIVLADGTTIQVAKNRGNNAMIYISDGNSWYEFYCG